MKEKERIKIIEHKLENPVWDHCRYTGFTTNFERRIWCCNGKHIEAVVLVDNTSPLLTFGKVGWIACPDPEKEGGKKWIYKDERIHNALSVNTPNEEGKWVPQINKITNCDCEKRIASL